VVVDIIASSQKKAQALVRERVAIDAEMGYVKELKTARSLKKIAGSNVVAAGAATDLSSNWYEKRPAEPPLR
jgi:hypothetical protein